jgi:hypothetical protein
MIESDYILRMIQQLAKAIARIVGLKQAGWRTGRRSKRMRR